ncbi:Myosin motor domain-containing protein [Plasmodiophora brassicae]
MELPPKPTNPDDMRDWQASCHRFFQAAEDIVVNAISEKQDRHVTVSRHARPLQILAKQLGIVKYERHPSKRRRSTYSGDAIVDTIPWPSMSAISPAPSLPRDMSSAWAATIAHTRSLDDRNRWDWTRLTGGGSNRIYHALFWVRQYTTKWEPPGMSLPPKPASSDGFSEWHASCYRYFKAAEDRVVEAIWEKQSDDADDAVEGSACVSRLLSPLRWHLKNSGLPINTERKDHKYPKSRTRGVNLSSEGANELSFQDVAV